jgi:broad specificity phosphatase PhoE
MAGEVHGGFDLNDRPATAAMRRLRREGEQLDLVLTKLGKTVDSIFSEKNVAEVVAYERSLARLDSQARRSFNSIGRNAREAEFQVVGSIRRMDSSVALLRENLDSLSREKATPKINLKGFEEALAQTELLHKRINALGREVATPRIGISQSSFAAGAIPSGGGGSSIGGRGGLRVPFAGAIPYPLVAGALAAAPPLVGATTAVGGSLGAAALGAGTLGLGAAGVGAAALGEIAPVAVSSVIGIKAASKALKSYREEVVKSGVNSEAARQKYRLYNMELEKAPVGTARFLKAKEGLVEDFQSSTRPAQRGFTGIGTRGLNLGRQLTPQFSRLSNEFFNEAQPQANKLGDFLASPESRKFYEAMGRESKAALGPTEGIAENITGTLMNLSRAARPFFHEGLVFLEKWTGGWHTSSKDIKGVRDDMAGWVGQLKTWGKLTGATFELLKDLGSAGAGEGQSLVGDLTEQLEVWDKWVERNPRQVQEFFHDSVESTEKLASAVGKIAHLIWTIGRDLGPMLDQLSSLVSLAGNAGLLTPGGLPFLLAGGAGIRSATRGLGGRIAGPAGTTGTTAGAPIILGGGAAAGGVSATARMFDHETYGLARGFGRGRIASTVAGFGASGAAERGAMFGRGFAGRFGPYALLAGGLGAASYQGNLHDRIQAGVSSATLGLVEMPKTPAEKADEANRHAALVSAYYAERYGGGAGGLQAQIEATRAKRHRLLTPQAPGGAKGFLQKPFGAGSVLGVDLGQPNTTEVSDSARKEAEALGRQLKALRDERVSSASTSALGDITGAFDIRARHGADPSKNYERTLGTIERRVSRMHGRTRKEFSQMGLDWAAEVAKANPKLKHAYNEMAEQMENRLRKAGAEIRVINGNIVDVSAKSWGKVADLIGTATQRAYEEANKNFTALEQRAFSILRQMGFSPHDSKGLVREAEVGHPSRAKSKEAFEAHRHGTPAPPTTSQIPGMGNARGGRLPVPANGSERDNVYLGNNQWGAGNELVVPSHTERQVNSILGRAGKTLGGMVAMNNRAHWQMPSAAADYAVGGRRFATGGRGIGPAANLAERMGMGVSGGPGHGGIPSSGHVSDSLHYQGLAFDITGSAAQMRRYFLTAWRDFHGSINELFYDPMGYYYDQGHKVPGAIGGHSDHVHIGFFPQGARMVGGKNGGGLRGVAGGRQQAIHLRGRHSGLGGVPGALANRSSDLTAAGMSRNLNKLIGGGGGRGRAANTAGGLNAWLTRALRITGHYSAANLEALRGRAMQESDGDPKAINNTDSNAAAGHPSQGLLQTIPETFAQYREPGLRGGILNPVANAAAAINYMFDRYGHIVGPSSTGYATGGRKRGGASRGFAGWFAGGGSGRVSGPTLIGVGESGPEDVTITPTPKRSRAGRTAGGHHPVEVNVNMGHVTVHGAQDTERVGKEIGRHAARELTKALQESDDVRDGELIGG